MATYLSPLDALESFNAAKWTYRVSLVGTALVASSQPEAIAAILRMSSGFAPIAPDLAQDAAKEIQFAAQEEQARACATLRQSALIACCAAIEALWKATLIEQSTADRAVLTRLKRKQALDETAAAAMSDEEVETLADEYFRRGPYSAATATKDWGCLARFRHLVGDVLQLPAYQSRAILGWLSTLERSDIDEAFEVRNCLIHNGGKANERVAQFNRFRLGDQILLTPALANEYIGALEYLASPFIDKLALGLYDEDDL